MMTAYFLTPIYTSSEKRQLISDRIKGPLVAAFRSPLMKALDRSVETLGLWIVTSSVHSLNLLTRVTSNHGRWIIPSHNLFCFFRLPLCNSYWSLFVILQEILSVIRALHAHCARSPYVNLRKNMNIVSQIRFQINLSKLWRVHVRPNLNKCVLFVIRLKKKPKAISAVKSNNQTCFLRLKAV